MRAHEDEGNLSATHGSREQAARFQHLWLSGLFIKKGTQRWHRIYFSMKHKTRSYTSLPKTKNPKSLLLNKGYSPLRLNISPFPAAPRRAPYPTIQKKAPQAELAGLRGCVTPIGFKPITF